MKPFDYSMDFERIDFRKQPDRYVTGKGEQGVLLVEPYKSEILPHWKFKTPADAKQSAAAIKKLFNGYKKQMDFAGMDMARKFIQMGYTRSRRYANHRSGKKYDGPVPADRKGQSGAHGRPVLPRVPDEEKAESALIFMVMLEKIKQDAVYKKMRLAHLQEK